MTKLDEHGDAILKLVSEGQSLTDACAAIDLPYQTMRKWTIQGRRYPDGRYGPWVKRLEAARGRSAPAGVSSALDTRDLGPVERSVEEIIAGRELKGENRLAAEQAKSLARACDELGATKGGAAKQALVSASRRLAELVETLRLPREDRTDEIRKRRFDRLADLGVKPAADSDRAPTTSSSVREVATANAGSENGHSDVPVHPGKRHQW